jgi:hypothetical protein
VYAGINKISKVITDATAPMDEIEQLRRNGIDVVIAAEEAHS